MERLTKMYVTSPESWATWLHPPPTHPLSCFTLGASLSSIFTWIHYPQRLIRSHQWLTTRLNKIHLTDDNINFHTLLIAPLPTIFRFSFFLDCSLFVSIVCLFYTTNCSLGMRVTQLQKNFMTLIFCGDEAQWVCEWVCLSVFLFYKLVKLVSSPPLVYWSLLYFLSIFRFHSHVYINLTLKRYNHP